MAEDGSFDWWGAVKDIAPIAAGAYGATQGGGSTTTSTTDAPWKEQQPYLQDVFGQARSLYDQTAGYGPFQGPSYATMGPMQRQALEGQNVFAGQGAQGAQNIFGMADRLGAPGAGAGDVFAEQAALARGGMGSVMSNFGQLQGLKPGMMANAGRDITRDLYENQIPGINQDAAAVGGARGSRAGAMEAVAKRGASDRLMDISSQIDANQMSQAQNMWGQQMTGLGAAGAGLGGVAGQAAGMYGSGYGLGQGALTDQYRAGAGFQADEQAKLDAARQQHQDFTIGAWGPLQQYGAAVGGQYGSMGTASTPNASPWQTGLGTGMAMYGMLNK